MDIEQLYLRYINDIYRYLYSLCKNPTLAEDLMQDTFYKAHITLLTNTVQDIKPWLFKVAYYTHIDYIRKERRVDLTNNLERSTFMTPETIAVNEESFHSLISLLDQLSPYEKQAIMLCDVHDCTYEQASNILDLKINTLKSHLSRGRKKMRVLIEKERQQYG
ncbi:sigma-70 family RNA polymerase sigma factor [Lysinibacillus xylanilyticus]|uniref:Sigma-70 family RNA polymerase sigma factor n=1 Tax=Lysinibacillus xylanilyticus TaxID=582475 RepID=A0ABT4EVE5_9BACI|nr:sigma-70 family RNA polymerase sigma factor [Lysinibacillus xylanilyticus]MCY9549640.1 sigma-70 family RNA polymerase sigma factor [Lysinibacillus xylanilyticus]MED3802953.1 sigma-70 family RNA polymerase sigma factor [Lysinibacillus xylanilyticus]